MQMRYILTINGGSSSIKFAVFDSTALTRRLSGKVERIGLPDTRIEVTDHASGQTHKEPAPAGDHLQLLIHAVEQAIPFDQIGAIGHRIVHGGPSYADPQHITPEILDALDALSPFDPQHLPAELAMIRAVMGAYPQLPQIACFDTAFHSDLPPIAKLLPIPRRYADRGVRRYGFHGLSYAYIMEELRRLDKQIAQGRLILAHLGSGASMAAVRDGKPIDTTMAFTPTAGLVMGTRTGDLDPGVLLYLAQTDGLSPDQISKMVNAESGLIGVSETSSDMRDLLERAPTDPRAADAVALFCYSAKKTLGAYAAALGGLDCIVFAGGIGENSAAVRAAICEGLGFLGIEIDATRNTDHAPIISTDASRVAVRIIKTDEESQIAHLVQGVLNA